MKRLAPVAILLAALAAQPAYAGFGWNRTADQLNQTGSCATTGSLSGVKVHIGNWTTTGAITATGLRLICTGNVTINHNITVQPEISAASRVTKVAAAYGTTMLRGARGGGIGGGDGIQFAGYGSAAAGSFGGSGGNCGSPLETATGKPGPTYTPDQLFHGSGGSSGWCTGNITGTFSGAGGRGGGGLYIQGRSITVNATIAANGEAGEAGDGTGGNQQGSGAPGSGGVISLRASNNITLGSSAILRANGGAGTASFYSSTGGGGGGHIEMMAGGSITEDPASTVEALGGTAAATGAGQVEAATNGSDGVETRIEGSYTPRFF